MNSTHLFRYSRPIWLVAILALSACSTLPTWMVLQGGRSRISDYQHFDNAPIAAAERASALRLQPTELRWPNSASFAEAAKFYLAPSIPEQVAKLRIASAPNQRYSYQSGDTQLLAMAIERAMGQSWAALVQSRLWQPMGAEYSASWSLDSQASGVARAFCCLNARAVDYLRFGMLMLGEDGVPGRHKGRQIVPADWVMQMTAAQAGLPGADDAAQRNIESPGTRLMAYYAWQWRRMPTLPVSVTDRPPSDDFFAEGLHGQLLYISPATQTVVLRLGRDWGAVNWPEWMSLLTRLNP
jgi:CubicO group peptidase (beta-lactamase class C family)